MDNITRLKLIFGFAIGFVALVSGALPQLFKKFFRRRFLWLSIANAFGGGVFLATAIIHMMPELLHGLDELGHDTGYPIGFLFILVGYIVILCLERVLFAHTHEHHPEEEQLHHSKVYHTTSSSKEIPPVNAPPEDGINASETSPLVHKKHRRLLLTPLLLLAVLSIHSVLEGTVLGVQKSDEEVSAIAAAILSHKWVESLSLGLLMVKNHVPRLVGFGMVSFFSLITPLGIFIGSLMSTMSQTIPTIFNALALGSFFYIGATEIVGDEFREVKGIRNRWFKFVGLLIGAALLCFIRIFDQDDR
jgi:zinc transporter 1/2/3